MIMNKKFYLIASLLLASAQMGRVPEPAEPACKSQTAEE